MRRPNAVFKIKNPGINIETVLKCFEQPRYVSGVNDTVENGYSDIDPTQKKCHYNRFVAISVQKKNYDRAENEK